jgi:hypothetical protein
MAEMTFPHAPNRALVSVNTGANTWAQVSVPSGLAGLPSVYVVLKSTDSTGAVDGSLFLVNFNQATAPSDGFPVSVGQPLSTTLGQNIWVKTTTATDLIKCLFMW